MTEHGVELEVDEAGIAHLHVCGEGPGVARFHALLREEAAKLGALGDPAPLEERMVRALGVIADRQAALDLTADSRVLGSVRPPVVDQRAPGSVVETR